LKKLVLVSLAVFLLALLIVGCAKELTLLVNEPEEGAVITESKVDVKGVVSDRKAIVMVNDVKAIVYTRGKGEFQASGVELTEGENTIKIIATRGKKEAAETITVTYSPE